MNEVVLQPHVELVEINFQNLIPIKKNNSLLPFYRQEHPVNNHRIIHGLRYFGLKYHPITVYPKFQLSQQTSDITKILNCDILSLDDNIEMFDPLYKLKF